MSSKFQSFLSFLENPGFKTSNVKSKEVVDSYTFLEISEKNDSELYFQISGNIKESKVIIISHYEEQEDETNNLYFVLSFKRTILVINKMRIQILQRFLSTKEKLEICFMFDTKEIFEDLNNQFEDTTIKYKEIKNGEFNEEEIQVINSHLFGKKPENFPHDDFLNIIKSSISGYLITQSYYTSDRIADFNNETNNVIEPRLITEDEIIELRVIEKGNESNVILYYHIEYEKLVIIKKYYSYHSEKEKLLKREIKNYEEINHPFIPKFYGTIQYNNLSYPVIEFINGKTLTDTDFSQFSETEIYEIILQMFLVFNYLHNNNFIYRDLKPNNVIIDENKNFVLIDFDRMIKEDENAETKNFESSMYTSQELNTDNISNKCDVYSLGKMIEFIKTKTKNLIKNYEKTILFHLYNKTINDEVDLRPNSSELFNDLLGFILENNYINIKKYICYLMLAVNQNDPKAQYNLGVIYYKGKYISRDIDKSIHYFSLAANQNNPEAQYNLGVIYYEGTYISQDIDKFIHYFSLAANQNIPEAQYNLGIIYYEGTYISRDINKSIYYLEKAAKHNHPGAQYNLGVIYYEGTYISQDIDKSIHYFSLAADKEYSKALFILGVIYEEGQYISRDINKSIYYLEKAAQHNHPRAQYNLGVIYYSGRYISRDIYKSIIYFMLAANQNVPEAQYNLGIIYYEGQYLLRNIDKAIYYLTPAANQNIPQAQFILGSIYLKECIPRDIDKAIYYYSLAANQNHLYAQYNLGSIFYKGQYISRDMNKAIYYFSLASNQNNPEAQYNLGKIYEEGKYIPRDINKSIHYYSLAANQNDVGSQYNLGVIYYNGQYIKRDINKAIYYFSLAANQNISEAQFILGALYIEGKHTQRDINKSIYYYSLAANNNNSKAQYNLGVIYFEGEYISQDLNKAIYYISLAANQNDSRAQFRLGFFYYEGRYISFDINKSIHYYSLAANQNYPAAQFNLGLIYYEGRYISKNFDKAIHYLTLASKLNYSKAQFNLGIIYYLCEDFKKGIYWITQSSNNEFTQAHFALGFLYHEGKYVKRNIDEAIKFYKKASSFDDQYAKNNLGIIYKYYFEKKYDYTVYYDEAIRQKNDRVSMYNISHSYIYEYKNEKLINKSIELLIKSSNLMFEPSRELLCLIILKNLFENQTNKKIDKIKIEQQLSKFTEKTNKIIINSIIDIIQKKQLYDQTKFENYYQKYEEIEFVYDLFKRPVCIKDLYNEENELKFNDFEKYNITSDFYEGFGHDLF